MQNTIADGLAGAATHPITVQVINQGPGIWGNVATGFITAVAAILAVILTHRYTHWRDKQAAVQKLKRERFFIATELIILLDQYAEGCAQVAGDKGEVVHVSGKQPERAPVVGYPAPLDFDKVAGDWSSLPPQHMYRIRKLPLRQAGAMRAIDYAWEHDSPGDYPAYFRERQYEFAQLGLTAISEARYLRGLCDLPSAGRNTSVWSAQNVISDVLKEQRPQRVNDQIANKENKL
ncbi:hypothetical protein JMT66_23805 (plasmid) [Kosakonia cowanii]|uniref:hypothetical protein n=1 Tax=Kosakonia cowanii TaxID=208223 RepID=UPI001E593D1D|nr:hypothetical protein [Kosakonia cowanii]UGS48568.1 hypothetical protein JMT66_23805 [Kosakonia cowanii]